MGNVAAIAFVGVGAFQQSGTCQRQTNPRQDLSLAFLLQPISLYFCIHQPSTSRLQAIASEN
jgi:hypothetical protein